MSLKLQNAFVQKTVTQVAHCGTTTKRKTVMIVSLMARGERVVHFFIHNRTTLIYQIIVQLLYCSMASNFVNAVFLPRQGGELAKIDHFVGPDVRITGPFHPLLPYFFSIPSQVFQSHTYCFKTPKHNHLICLD